MSEARAQLEAAVMRAMEVADGTPARWGIDDCGLWFANMVRDALGYDPAVTWRGRYDTRDGAHAVLGRGGLGMAFHGLARQHGWRRIQPLDAKVGDPGLAIVGGGATTFICRAPGWFVVRSETTFCAIQAAGIRMAWSICDPATAGKNVTD